MIWARIRWFVVTFVGCVYVFVVPFGLRKRFSR